MEPMKPGERRRSPRITVSFPVVLTWGRKQYRWPAREFSEFGILLGSTHKELVGEEVEVELMMNPPTSTVSLGGAVVYATGAGIAVRFKQTSAEQRAILRSYIQAHAAGAAKP